VSDENLVVNQNYTAILMIFFIILTYLLGNVLTMLAKFDVDFVS